MAFKMDERYDASLLGILQSEGKIQPFLDVVFGFLFRRTDFYKHLEDDASGKMGFLAGVAEKLTYNAFKKYQNLARKCEEDARIEAEKSARNQPENIVDREEVVETSVVGNERAVAEGQEQLAREAKGLDANVVLAEADSYNGAVRDTYTWSQSSNDLDVRIKIPKDIVKAKSLKVNMLHDRLSLSCWRQESSTWETILDGQLTFKINLEKSVWTLVPGEYVHVCLEKNGDCWWEALLIDEPKIDVRKIEGHRYMDELPDVEQAKLEELMFNQEQMLLGKPTIEQMKIQDVLKEAWDKEGSPFRGQPFDPSIVNVTSDSAGELVKNLAAMNP